MNMSFLETGAVTNFLVSMSPLDQYEKNALIIFHISSLEQDILIVLRLEYFFDVAFFCFVYRLDDLSSRPLGQY